MISTADFRTGIAILLNGGLYTIVGFQHVKPGKGGAFVRTKLRRLPDGSILDQTFRAGEKFQDAFIEKRNLQYLYRSGDTFHFMDTASYEDVQISEAVIGDAAKFLKEDAEIQGQFHEGRLIAIQPPNFIEVRITSTEPGVRGDTSKAAMKPSIIETGATVFVPLFVNTGDVVKVDTRTGEYMSRA